jgi:ParB/RepB/Spo0J family partition protein
MNTTTTTQDVQTQQGEGTWVDIAGITIPEDARVHSPEDIDSRAQSMDKEGQLQNALLSKEGDKLVLVYGHGRLLSAQKLGWEKLRCDIKEGLTETQKLLMTLAENEERENASPFYTAGLYQRLMEMGHLTQEQLADELGKTKKLVEKYAVLLSVSPELHQNPNALGLSLRQCLEIAKLTKPEDQLKVMEECATQDLSGKALESRVKQLLNPKAAPSGAGESKEPTGPFQFLWKGNGLVIKGRPFTPHTESIGQYVNELTDAFDRFMEEEKNHNVANAA